MPGAVCADGRLLYSTGGEGGCLSAWTVNWYLDYRGKFMNAVEALDRLAQLAGIEEGWWDFFGQWRPVSADSSPSVHPHSYSENVANNRLIY